MRNFLIGFSLLVLGSSCIKKKSIGPVPEIEFLEFTYKGSANYDSATFKLGYIDSDGDLFRDKTSDGANMVFKTLVFNPDSNKYVLSILFPRVILQPASGYYKGKAIQGYIYLNESEFRKSRDHRRLKFEVFMTDSDGNKSNIATSTTTLSS